MGENRVGRKHQNQFEQKNLKSVLGDVTFSASSVVSIHPEMHLEERCSYEGLGTSARRDTL